MGTYAKIEIYEDADYICTILRTTDGDLLAEHLSLLVEGSTILSRSGNSADEYGIGCFASKVVTFSVREWEEYTQLTPLLEERFDINVRINIPGRRSWQESGWDIEWRGKPTIRQT